ncbi:MAG: hypothetical protein CVT62_07200 [Actinobacteria bacterium HGW-Actinobacteria-2]|nr:MAG: hypothetical protein CVT62_07200 [Actinobacteria bacterium HGW-Actinobacteria-2]
MHPRILPLAIVAAVGVALSVALVIYGLPEATAGQAVALSLSALPLSVSVAAGALMLLQRAQRTPTALMRWSMIGGGILAGIGLMMMVVSLPLSAQAAVQFGQFLVFVGLLIVLLIAIALQTPARTEWFALAEVADLEEDSTDITEDAPRTADEAEAAAVDPDASL